MNTNDVERRLEALAAESANPDMPLAILDRMAQLEAGAAAIAPVVFEAAPRLHRVRVGGSPRARGLMLLGLAAVLALIGGLMYVAGGHRIQGNPEATPTASPAPSTQVEPMATPPSLESWRQVHTFSSEWTFGSIWGRGIYLGVWLDWQNGEIVGLAERFNASEQQRTCVLQSKDGTNWTCGELPTPTGEACGPGPCPEVAGLAVRDGRWVVVGYSNFRRPADGGSGLSSDTLLTWTSTDGTTWTEQPSARSTPTFVGQSIDAPSPPAVLATSSGFVMSRCSGTYQPGLWTSADGTSWQPATFAPGSQTMTCGTLGSSSTAGYAASGTCQRGTMAYPGCVAVSADGITWTTSDPAAGASPELAGHLRITPLLGPTYVAGHWIVYLDTAGEPDTNPYDASYYEASSPDGTHWTLAPVPWPDLVYFNPGADESDYHPAAYSGYGASGYWAVANGPRAVFAAGSPGPAYTQVPATPSTYWSPNGMYWQRASDAPPGWPIAVVETPTELVAFMSAIPGDGPPITSVWVAPKK